MSLQRCFDVNPFVENVSSDMSHCGTVAFLTHSQPLYVRKANSWVFFLIWSC